MNGLTRKALILLSSTLFLLNAGCTSIKTIDTAEETTYSQQIEVGERIRLTYLDGRVQDIHVTNINATEISGTIHQGGLKRTTGRGVVVDWRDVHLAERVKISALKTAGAAVGIVAAIPFLAVGVMMAGAGSY
jgi:hypothetical protein